MLSGWKGRVPNQELIDDFLQRSNWLWETMQLFVCPCSWLTTQRWSHICKEFAQTSENAPACVHAIARQLQYIWLFTTHASFVARQIALLALKFKILRVKQFWKVWKAGMCLERLEPPHLSINRSLCLFARCKCNKVLPFEKYMIFYLAEELDTVNITSGIMCNENNLKWFVCVDATYWMWI